MILKRGGLLRRLREQYTLEVILKRTGTKVYSEKCFSINDALFSFVKKWDYPKCKANYRMTIQGNETLFYQWG